MEKSGSEAMSAKEGRGEKWTSQDIKKAQEALKDKGHDPGSMDGVVGPKTRQAIKAFQSANGLKETGALDPDTAQKLGVEKRGDTPASGSAGMRRGQPSAPQKTPSSPGK
jgi:peptidoglycan hydrolase-like protein with peptidoglycan-binding domain